MKKCRSRPVPERTAVHSHFADADQQRDASTIGMWIFLATEVMFFGTLIAVYVFFRYLNPAAFAAASRHADFWLGTANTAVLLISSLTMALAVHAAKAGERGLMQVSLFLTMLLGTAFLTCKGVEYSHHIHEHLWPGASFAFPDAALSRGAEMFFYLYFVMTGLHALHMIGGIAVVAVIFWMGRRGMFSPAYSTPVELTGLYWHFVDIVWIFLFPLFYLIGGR
jgi:cytochrome c oxidase subunit 3